MNSFTLKKEDFGTEFLWGVTTSVFQTGDQLDFSLGKNTVSDNLQIGEKKKNDNDFLSSAADTFESYKEDIRLIKELGIPNFRFSISWSHIIPGGVGEISKEGISFYNYILDLCKENNIEPFVTLYQGDLPSELEKQGGWTNRNILNWFEEYTKVCVTAFKDKVKHWIVLNEPSIFLGGDYFLGINGPKKNRLNSFLPAMHHAMLCQSIGYRTIKKIDSSCQVGTSLSCTYITPKTYSEKNIKAAERIDTLLNKAFIEPLLGLGYPSSILPFFKYISKYSLDGDDELIKVEFDFIGLQNYTREVVEHHSYTPYINAKLIPIKKRTSENAVMNWEEHPKSIYMMILKYSEYIGVKKILITDNGASFLDEVKLDVINDEQRTIFIQNYLQQVYYAQNRSDKVKGYFIRSLTDNIEIIQGNKQRFGLIYKDYNTDKRIIKNSGKWYKEFLKSRQAY